MEKLSDVLGGRIKVDKYVHLMAYFKFGGHLASSVEHN